MHTLKVAQRSILALAATLVMLCGGCAIDAPNVTATPELPPRNLMLGAWNLTTPTLVESAAADGVNTAFLYDPPPQPSSPLGRALTKAHMRVISAEVSELVSAYECTRTHTIVPNPMMSHVNTYCSSDPNYTMSRLLSEVSTLARRDATNPLVAGYWVLDDTPDWDFGSLRTVLARIRAIIPADRPTICGFSAGLQPSGSNDWEPRRADNFTSDGCNMVAPYIYSTSQNPSDPAPRSIDWQMRDLLPRIKESLTESGWKSTREPLVGIGQAWGGKKIKDGSITYPPTAVEMAAQAQAYCTAGATGIGWYAWDLANYTDVHTPLNDPVLSDGVRTAIHACRAAS